MRIVYCLLALSWTGLWLTPNQAGQRYFHEKKFVEAAATFEDPLWQGTAWYRAGEFEKATQSFARVPTAEGKFNEGNSWLMLGKYDQAIASYEQALKKQPAWKEAQENLELATIRRDRIKQEGGDLGDQKEGADQIVFDKKKEGGEDTEVEGDKATSDASVQAIWLRQVQTKPADFLKAKFAYQYANDDEEPSP